MDSIHIRKEPLAVFINNKEINTATTIHSLKDMLNITTNERVNCKLHEDNLTISIWITFENNQIQSLSIHIPEYDNDFNPAIEWDFYHQIPQRKEKYKKWLKKHTDTRIDDHSFANTGIGVGNDKSDNTFILISWNMIRK